MTQIIPVELTEEPTLEELRTTLTNYLGGWGRVVAGNDDQYELLALCGPSSDPLESLDEPLLQAIRKPRSPERWFGVQRMEGGVNVELRQPDEATRALAEGYANFVARYWRGHADTGP